jgi:hypothetical protein
MAIFFLSVQALSRSRGRSAVAAAAYRTASRLYDSRRKTWCDFRKKQPELIDTFIITPPGTGDWTRQNLWDSAEHAERRVNSTICRDVVVALPIELDRDDHTLLLTRFARGIAQQHGCALEISVHDPVGAGSRNIHGHIQISTRRLHPGGFGGKVREFDDWRTGRQIIREWRLQWATLVNAVLASRGFRTRIDHRSYAERKLLVRPTIKEGTGPLRQRRVEYNREVRRVNSELIETQLALEKALSELATIPQDDSLRCNRDTEYEYEYEYEEDISAAPESEDDFTVDDSDKDGADTDIER